MSNYVFFHLFESIFDWLRDHWSICRPLAVVLLLYWYAASMKQRSPYVTLSLGTIALLLGLFSWFESTHDPVIGGLFSLFAGMALVGGFCMLIESNPVFAALWFALVILSVCGIFLLQSASFLSAATIIVYAGAIIVTFLFVVMLARQNGSAIYDQNLRAPIVCSTVGCILTAIILNALPQAPVGTKEIVENNVVPRADAIRSLGTTLFTQQLWSVEIAGGLLFVATFGTILIALQPREAQA